VKLPIITLAALALAACATVQPYKTVETTSKDPAAAFDCALGKATSMDYTPDQVSKESGFFKAEHNYRPGMSSIRWGSNMTDALAVLVAKNATGETTIQVTGSSGANAGRNLRLIESTKEVKDAANQITQSCK
jgi:hypothetical protein